MKILKKDEPYNLSIFKIIEIIETFLRLSFNYCPLIWMCHGRETRRKINQLHERCLRTICDDK